MWVFVEEPPRRGGPRRDALIRLSVTIWLSMNASRVCRLSVTARRNNSKNVAQSEQDGHLGQKA